VERIRTEVNKRVQENRLKDLLNAWIKHHTRKGLRDCNCNFCQEKRAGTRYIGFTPFPFYRYNEEFRRLQSICGSTVCPEDLAREIILKERERKREIVRERLRKAKEEIL